jgi:hypothetical protein
MTNLPISPVESPAKLDAPTCRWEGQITNGLGTTYGFPAATLCADSTELVLTGTIGTFRLPRASVQKVGRAKLYPWFFAGIRFHHNNPGCPEELQFTPLGLSSRAVIAQLQILGYPVG